MAMIVICDSCDVFRLGLAARVSKAHEVKMVSAAQGVGTVVGSRPDLLILDAATATRPDLTLPSGGIPVLLLVDDGTVARLPEVLKRVAPASILHRNASMRTALVAVDTTLDGGRYVDPALAGWRDGLLDQAMSGWGLTARERDVCRAALDGSTATQIAREFGLSRHTVKHHLSSVYSKVEVSGREELTERLAPFRWLS